MLLVEPGSYKVSNGHIVLKSDVVCGGGAAVPCPFTNPASGWSYQACIALMLLVEPGSYKVSIEYVVLLS